MIIDRDICEYQDVSGGMDDSPAAGKIRPCILAWCRGFTPITSPQPEVGCYSRVHASNRSHGHLSVKGVIVGS